MTETTNLADGLPSSPLLLVEAFADGERVEPGALVDALADQSAREHLVHVLMLREAVADMSPLPWHAGARARHGGHGARWVAAAAAVILSLAAGYVAGQRTFVPIVEASSVLTVVQIDTSPPPPTPTHVITLQPGVNWTEHAGEP